MSAFRTFVLVLVGMLGCGVRPWTALDVAAAEAPDPVGTWTGALDLGGTALPVRFHVTGGQGERLKVTMDSPDQGAFGIQGTIDLKGGEVEIRVSAIQGRFRGSFADDGRRLVGHWVQSGHDLPLVLEREVVTTPAVSPAAIASQPHGAAVPGTWLGTLTAGARELRLQFHVTDKDGELDVSLDSLDQGAKGIPALAELHPAREVVFRVPSASGDFRGTLAASGDTLSGRWAQSGREFPLVLVRTAGDVVLHRPQEPQPPFPYAAIDVSFPGGAADVTLAGTLTVPVGDGPFPAAVLVSGSGPQDRNEELMGHKPFLVLADYLTRRGIAVLRYDDRGFAGSTGDFAAATSVDFAADAEAALEFLRGRPEARSGALGIVGHSEGGLIAPMVAARRPDIGFIVLLAGPGVDGRDVLRRQSSLLMRAAGASEEAIAAELGSLETAFAAVEQEPDVAKLETRLVADLTAAAESAGETPDSTTIATTARQFATPWFRFFLLHDPVPDLAAVRCPVLALNGSLDLQVDPDQNLPAIRAALEQGGNPRFEVRELEGLNHLFQTAETGALAEYGKIEETMAPVMMETVAAWILEVTARK